LAQIDSSIGGKVGVDLPVGKNLVGAFYQPKVVISDLTVLKTLDHRQMLNGMAEAIKYGLIKDAQLYSWITESLTQIYSFAPEALEHLVLRCSEIKRDVVLDDEKEVLGIRTILNFGHTAGHAIESCGQYEQYQHGEAIGLGMRVAVKLSALMGVLRSQALVKQINHDLDAIGLPKTIEKIDVSAILERMKHDKKFLSGRKRFMHIEDIGHVTVQEDVPLDLIRKALESCL
jgi:3-dehydroquinate synthase